MKNLKTDKNIDELILKLKSTKKKIVLYCASDVGEDVLDFMVGKGIYPYGFCDNDSKKAESEVFGYYVNNYDYYKQNCTDVIFVITNPLLTTSKIIGKQLVLDGFIKDQDFFIFCEYYIFTKRCKLINLLKISEIVLVGSVPLSNYFFEYLRKKKITYQNIVYLKIPNMEIEDDRILDKKMYVNGIEECKEKYPNAIYFILHKKLFNGSESKWLEAVVLYLVKNKIRNISFRYVEDFSYVKEAIVIRKPISKYSDCNNERLKIEDFDNILQIYGGGGAYSGTILTETIFDSHPNIIYIGMNAFQSYLWFAIQYFKGQVKASDIGVKLVNHWANYIHQELGNDCCTEIGGVGFERFIAEFNKTISLKEYLDEKEIFVAAYIAIYYAKGNIYQSDKKPFIFFDAHSNLSIQPIIEKWFMNNFINYKIIQPIRDTITRLGSSFRYMEAKKGQCDNFYGDYRNLWRYIPSRGLGNLLDKKVEEHIVRYRFEDLKLHPKETISMLCGKIGLPWSDTLLETTLDGIEYTYKMNNSYEVTGFNLKPVYNQYTEYFSSFDRFRLDILFQERQRAYDYPTIDMSFYKFNWEQLRNLYKFPFKFEQRLLEDCATKEQRKIIRDEIYESCLIQLNYLEHKNKYFRHFQYGDFLKYYTI